MIFILNIFNHLWSIFNPITSSFLLHRSSYLLIFDYKAAVHKELLRILDSKTCHKTWDPSDGEKILVLSLSLSLFSFSPTYFFLLRIFSLYLFLWVWCSFLAPRVQGLHSGHRHPNEPPPPPPLSTPLGTVPATKNAPRTHRAFPTNAHLLSWPNNPRRKKMHARK